MGSVERHQARMKTIVLLTVIFSSTLAFDVNLNPESESSRSFCCLFYNADTECGTRCAGRDCTEQCNTFCGVTNSLCGSMTCSAATTNCITPPTSTTTSTSTSTSTSPSTTTTACIASQQECDGTSTCCSGSCGPNTVTLVGTICP